MFGVGVAVGVTVAVGVVGIVGVGVVVGAVVGPVVAVADGRTGKGGVVAVIMATISGVAESVGASASFC